MPYMTRSVTSALAQLAALDGDFVLEEMTNPANQAPPERSTTSEPIPGVMTDHLALSASTDQTLQFHEQRIDSLNTKMDSILEVLQAMSNVQTLQLNNPSIIQLPCHCFN